MDARQPVSPVVDRLRSFSVGAASSCLAGLVCGSLMGIALWMHALDVAAADPTSGLAGIATWMLIPVWVGWYGAFVAMVAAIVGAAVGLLIAPPFPRSIAYGAALSLGFVMTLALTWLVLALVWEFAWDLTGFFDAGRTTVFIVGSTSG